MASALNSPHTQQTPKVLTPALQQPLPRTYYPSTPGTKRISVTLRERRETLPSYLLPVPDCRCGLPAKLKARVLGSGRVEYLYQCDPGQGQCGFTLFKGPSR